MFNSCMFSFFLISDMKGRVFVQRKKKKPPKMAELINPITLVCLFSQKRAGGGSLGEDLLGVMM